jgi:uncharacterized protein YcfL
MRKIILSIVLLMTVACGTVSHVYFVPYQSIDGEPVKEIIMENDSILVFDTPDGRRIFLKKDLYYIMKD